MVVTLGEVLQRPLQGCFMTVHAQGEIEPHFYDEFKGELGSIWRLYDQFDLQLKVEFIHDDEMPRIKNGWKTLREHYKLDSHHHIFFKYLGTNQFQIIPIMKPITPDIFPSWHTHSRGLRIAVNFTMTNNGGSCGHSLLDITKRDGRVFAVFEEGSLPEAAYNIVKDQEYCGEIKVALTFTAEGNDERGYNEGEETTGRWKESARDF